VLALDEAIQQLQAEDARLAESGLTCRDATVPTKKRRWNPSRLNRSVGPPRSKCSGLADALDREVVLVKSRGEEVGWSVKKVLTNGGWRARQR
jgi:hypothetical protein